MKNWKYIKVGNAEPKVTELSGKEGSGVVERMSNQFFVSYKLNNGEKGIEKFQTEAQAVSFLKKKVGNEDIGLRPVQGEIEKEVYSVYTQTGKDKEKTKKALKAKHPNLDEQWLDKLLSKLVGNESIFKQEASMFEGLKKDAEKEIGNADLPTEQDLKNWIRMMEQDKREAQREMDRWKHHTEGQYSGDQFNTAMVKYNEAVSQIKKMQEELRQGKFKKIGNETKGERKFGKVIGEFEEGALKTPQGKTVTDPAQAKAIAYSEADKVDNLKRARNAMNKKVGNLDHVEEGDYVSVRHQGEIVDGVVRKIQGTQALVTIEGTDIWFPIRSLKEST